MKNLEQKIINRNIKQMEFLFVTRTLKIKFDIVEWLMKIINNVKYNFLLGTISYACSSEKIYKM